MPNKDKLLMRHLGCSKVYADFTKTRADSLKGYIRVHGNGAYINYDNGFRRIPCKDSVKDDAARIYLFGYCISANPMLPDNETICARIQDIAGGMYQVLSRSNDQSGINLIMRSEQFHSGDYVYVFTSFHDQEPEKLGYDTIDLTEMFNDIPFLWKHITDSSFHIDSFLANKIAKLLCDSVRSEIKSNDIKTLTFGLNKKTAPDIGMYKDDSLIEYVNMITSQLPKSTLAGYNGAIVMNCNPFTNGHKFLIESALKQVDNLFIFVVAEDKSYFKFVDRFAMVKEGTKDLENVYVFPSGDFMISSTTLPGYFDKNHLGGIGLSASDDLELFASIANYLNVQVRFAGTEPNDRFTGKYNREMQTILPSYGIAFKEIERCQNLDSDTISASKVRKIINEKDDLNKILKYVPESTYRILVEKNYIKLK